MKKMFFLSLAMVMASVLFGCSANTPSSSQSSSTPSTADSISPLPVSEDASAGSSQASTPDEPLIQRLYIADAGMYRGIITKMEADGANQILTLQQAEGTDFGAPTLQMRVTPDTMLSFSRDLLKKDAYIELFYGLEPNTKLNPTEVYDAMGVNFYDRAEMVNFNGIIQEITPNADSDSSGMLVMEDLKNGETVIFNYSGDTLFYTDFDALKKGDKLNIFHRGIYTRSLPPQGMPLEVRLYHEAK